ncbi:hypothetical protein J1N35_044707 [Gossypium stocksii]|uniref:Uncharacterized protein n=1 Tax=Gossypium stocksii TaxID=47602 RepID=A0A9D3U9M9_9ROSI|nr:hypothetical protein J1N35_044707 [Gossypium stocksii]
MDHLILLTQFIQGVVDNVESEELTCDLMNMKVWMAKSSDTPFIIMPTDQGYEWTLEEATTVGQCCCIESWRSSALDSIGRPTGIHVIVVRKMIFRISHPIVREFGEFEGGREVVGQNRGFVSLGTLDFLQ